MTPIELQNYWRRHKHLSDTRARNCLITHFAYLVKITAGRVVNNMPANMERDDLVSAGIVGLIKAVDQFDLTRQVKFETYAIALIRGAILDTLRQDDWVPRSTRERLKAVEQTYRRLELEHGRPATDDEAAKAMNIETDELHKLLFEGGRTSVLSLDDILCRGDGGEKTPLLEMIFDSGSLPSLEVELTERRRTLVQAVDRLPERENLIIALYYYEGLTFREVASILKISEARVYQLHTQAVVRLRSYLKQDTELFH